jgi:hypothetical protein
MNLGPQRISDTYQFVLNASGGSVTLGNGNNPNWMGTTVASTTGAQTISGVKTFNSTINANITGSAGSATSATSAVSASGLFLTTSDGNTSSTTMYPVLFSGTTVGGNQRAHIDSAGLSYNASTNALTATSFVGNASTAATLTTSRNINGTAFNGSTNIDVEPFVENDYSANSARYLTFVDSSNAAYQRLNNDNKLSYNPSSGSLTINNLFLGTQTNKARISYLPNEARTFTIPSVTANSTFAFRDQAQTFTSNQVINANLRVQGNLDFGTSTLGGTAASSFFKTNAGQLGTTSGNAINLASIGFLSANNISLSFIARRQSNGSTWTTSAIGLTYNVDAITGIGPGASSNIQEIWMLPDGNVGLGTNAPTQKLDINGNLRVRGSITCASGIDLSNKNTKLTADISMPAANTWYDIVSISLEAGTWLVGSSFLYSRTNNVADIAYCRITDKTNHFASTSQNRQAANNATLNLATTTIITVASTTTIWLQAAQNTTAAANVALTKAVMIANGAGNNATQITAIRVG